MKLLQKASYNKGVTEVQQETTECQTRGTDIQRMRPRTHITNCNLIGREWKKINIFQASIWSFQYLYLIQIQTCFPTPNIVSFIVPSKTLHYLLTIDIKHNS